MQAKRTTALVAALAMMFSLVIYAPQPAMAASVDALSSESTTATVAAPTEAEVAETPASVVAPASIPATETVASNKVAPATMVTPAATGVCEINGTPYDTLVDAVAAVTAGQTITLLQNVTSDDLTLSQGFAFTIDKAGFDLTFASNSFNLGIDNATKVTIVGAGALVLQGSVDVRNSSNLTIDGDLTCYKLGTMLQGEIDITGNVTSTISPSYESFCDVDRATVNIGGSVTVPDGSGFSCQFDSCSITVGGDITCSGTALYLYTFDQATVHGNISSTYGPAIFAGNSQVTVTGDVSAADGDAIIPTGADTQVTVVGNVSAPNGTAIDASYADGAQVTVTGDVTAVSGFAVIARNNSTTVVVNGDVSASGGYAGVDAEDNASVTVNGNITSDDTGVYADSGAEVTVNGSITAARVYIELFDGTTGTPIDLTPDDFVEPTTKAGYKTYTNGVSTVWVANSYNITVQTDGNGTASANTDSAIMGTAITLTATPNSGYTFKGWQVISGDITITGNTFVMPASDVTVKALFEKVVAPTPPTPPTSPASKPGVALPATSDTSSLSLKLPALLLGSVLALLAGVYFALHHKRRGDAE